jgi:hypothetical protein
MATSDNPFVPIPVTDTDDHEGHLHKVPVANVDDDRETLEYEPPDALRWRRKKRYCRS